jgi:hypothetical protein
MLSLARGLAGIYREPARAKSDASVTLPFRCPVCGSSDFTLGPVPEEWDEIFANLEPVPGELEVLHRREHLSCDRCRANLRSMALTHALLNALHWPASRSESAFNLVTLLATRPWLRLLEINESHVVGPLLRRLPRHVSADFPDVDAQSLPFADRSFSLVVHSDTLEHVPDPHKMLRECARVLQSGGQMIFTVPIRPDKMTRSREGMAPVYHGDTKPPYRSLVCTDFGSDLWTVVCEAGFVDIEMAIVEYPAGVAYVARR